MSTVTLTLDKCYALALDALTAQGVSEPQATAIAETVTHAERDECASHGLFRIPFYIKALSNRYIVADAEPVLSRSAPGVLRVDAGFGFAPYALKCGIPPLIDAARSQGVAILAINNSYHIAGLWPEAEAIANAGLVGFVFTNSLPAVAPAGGTKALFGTNPMAFAWPRNEAPPLVFDQASSVIAKGDVMLHERDGKSIPEGLAIGPDGRSTTDPAAALQGALLPFGGHKGSSIALMIELLAGALIGDLFSYEVIERDPSTKAPCGGELLIAIDPAQCAGTTDRDAQDAHAEALFARIHEQQGARLPSERRWRVRERTIRDGISIPGALFDELTSYASTVGR